MININMEEVMAKYRLLWCLGMDRFLVLQILIIIIIIIITIIIITIIIITNNNNP